MAHTWKKSLIALFLLGGTSSAADLRMHDHGDAEAGCPSLRTIELVGDIEAGDFERLHAMLPPGQATTTGQYVPVERLSLDSEGGDYFEAVKIAHLLRGYHIQTYVAGDAHCSGACAIAFMSGTGIAMEGYFPPDRRFVPGARITLSLPSFVDRERRQEGSELEISEKARDLALQLFVEILLLANDREWSQDLVGQLVENGPGHDVDLTLPANIDQNRLRLGKNCQPYRQWLEER